jgi:hypothetical protein
MADNPSAVYDLAPELFNRLDLALRPDAPWRLREDRALTWWPCALRQRIEALDPRDDRGVPATRIVAVTPIAMDIEDTSHALLMAAAANQAASLSAVVVDVESGTVGLALAASVRPKARVWLLPMLADAIGLQVAVAGTADIDELAAGFGGVPDLAWHPEAGPRTGVHSVLEMVERAQRDGLATVRMPETDFRRSVGDLSELGIPAVAEGTRLEVGVQAPGLGGDARVVIECATHPGFGNGLLVLVEAPLTVRPADGPAIANHLNLAELVDRAGGMSFGAWTTAALDSGSAGLAHVAFLPNLLLPLAPESDRRARLVNLVIDAVLRVQWLDQTWPSSS